MSKPAAPKPQATRLYSVDNIAERFGLSPKTIRRLIASKQLTAHRIGRQWRISDADADAFLARRRG